MARELNSFGEDVYGLSGSIKLDSSVKKILSYRPILANILKDSCTDFSKFNVDEIISMIDRIHMESIPVGPGQTNDPIDSRPQLHQSPEPFCIPVLKG